MDILYKVFFGVFTLFTYVVTFHDGIKIFSDSYKYGKLRKLQVLQVRLAIRLLPGYLREKMRRFSDDDIDIQIKKLNGNNIVEQINALKHLEQILKFIPTESTRTKDFENIKRIQRAILKILWLTKTDSKVVKKAVDMLCGNDHLWSEYGCNA